MAQNITLMGASYSDVPSVNLPKTGGGTASFTDVTDTTASASDVAQGKYFYTSSGVRAEGTASGGGTSNWKFLKSQEFTVNTTSTSNTSVGDISLTLSDYDDPNTVLWVHIRDKAGKRNGYYYGSDTIFFHAQLASGSTNSYSIRPVFTIRANSDGTYTGAASAYGVYAYSLYYTSSNHYVKIYSRYNSSTTLTINGTYKCDVYVLTPPSGMTLFAV